MPVLNQKQDEILDYLWQQRLQNNYGRNKKWIGKEFSPTQLSPEEEKLFRQWILDNRVRFDPNNQGLVDYDMRGFYKALMEKDPKAVVGINPVDQKIHYPDYWKTPYHESFSSESQWANPDTAPQWKGEVLYDRQGGIVYQTKGRK